MVNSFYIIGGSLHLMLIKAIGTETFLLISFCLLYLSSEKTKKSFVIQSVFFLVGGIPLAYAVIDHLINNYRDANIGLGLIFMYTWLFSAITVVVGIIKLVLKKRKP
jgi:hypothetical protein